MSVQQVAGNFAYRPYSFITIPRFSAKYWSCNGPLTARMGLVSSGTSIKCSCELQEYSDFVGILWFSQDQFSHPLLQYAANTDYSGTTLSFTYTTSSNFTSFSDPTAEPIMTVTYTNGSVEYVSLIRYASVGYTAHSANVTINFDTFVGGSFYAGPGTPIPSTGIAKLEFGIFAEGYDPSNHAVISTGSYTPGTLIWLELSNIAASTNSGGNPANALMQVGNYVISPLNGVGIANDYDSTYNVTPQLLVETWIAMGFSYVDHYCGVRPYSLVWDSGAGRFIINAAGSINQGFIAWHTDFAARLTAAGIPFTFAMSFELYTADIPANWDQQDWNNNSAETGYANPTTYARFMDSSVVGPFLQTLFTATVALVPPGANFTAQLGEYAWWSGRDNGPSHATIGPCIFDYATRVAYNTATGLFAPEILSIVSYASLDSDQQAYVNWCRGALGAFCDIMAAAIIAARAGTKISALFYYDAISDQADAANGFMQQLNIPYEHWQESHGTLTTIEGEMYGDTTPIFFAADLMGLYETLTGTSSLPPQLGYVASSATFYTGIATNPDASANEFENFVPMLAAANAAATMGFGIVYWWAWTQFQQSGFYLQNPPPTPPEPPPGPPLPPSPLTTILPAYPYQQYQDDPNVVAFFTAYNQIAQSYLDWFNNVPLAVYTSPNVTGSLLDWIGNGIYGIPRPVFSNLATRFHGAALDGVPLNTIAINGSRTTSSGGAILATDDFYKRVITWLTYVGDGRMFNMMVLRKRIARFLFGVNGTDITLSQAQAVIINFASPTEFQIAIPSSANPASAYFVEALNSGILPLPFQLSAEVIIT